MIKRIHRIPKSVRMLAGMLAIGAGCFAAGVAVSAADKEEAPNRIFELRTYITAEGRLDALNKRFREHTNALFVKHGMELVGYWTPTDGPESKNTLIYILAYKDQETRAAAWKGFLEDPDWKAARDASEKDGKIVEKVISQMLAPTDYSPIK